MGLAAAAASRVLQGLVLARWLGRVCLARQLPALMCRVLVPLVERLWGQLLQLVLMRGW